MSLTTDAIVDGPSADPKPLSLVQLGAEWITENVGGANRYTAGIAQALADENVRQRWLVMARDALVAPAKLSVKAVASPEVGLRDRWAAMRAAWPEASADADVVTSHFALYAFPLRDELRRMPHVVHFHGPWADESRAEGGGILTSCLKRRLEREVYLTGDRYVVLSRAFAEILSKRYAIDSDRIRVVPGGVDCNRFESTQSRDEVRDRLGWPLDRPIILCVRRLVRRVGIEQLLESMVALRTKRPDALLCIAGKGPLSAEVSARVESLGLGDSVRLLGFVSDADLPLAYRAADFSVVPSQSLEGFGLVIVESLASGTPALVTPVGGMPEVVGDFDSSLVLSDKTPGAIAEGMLHALDSLSQLPDEDRCRRLAYARFDWPVIAGRVLNVYREAIESHG